MHPLYIHGFVNVSEANGPGRRAVLWLQGCTLGCPGCCNPETHSTYSGRMVDFAYLIAWVKEAMKEGIEGVTLTGGEPLQQAYELFPFVVAVKKLGLSVVLYTGYDEDEIRPGSARSIWLGSDIVVSGRYMRDVPEVDGRPVGSGNQRITFNGPRYTHKDMDRWGTAELIVTPKGSIIQTGVMPGLVDGAPGRVGLS